MQPADLVLTRVVSARVSPVPHAAGAFAVSLDRVSAIPGDGEELVRLAEMLQQLHSHAGHRCVISSCAVTLHLTRCCPNCIASGTTKFVWFCCAGRGALQPAIRGKPSDGGGHPSAAICRAVSLSRLWLVLGRVSSSRRQANILWKLSASCAR